ncbi:MAG TPA: hypothetical protein VHQ01_12295, partial [Pyrinomonadaceae bacterium]|nr:hypothetical protein [Pyrinomonadaceae bacterium]
KRDLVIASCGGFPHDINMIQAHKTLDAVARACNDGGTILLLAECADGLGRPDFLTWFEAADSGELAVNLCKKYQVNGQTAWSLLRKAERFEVKIVTDLDGMQTEKMRLAKINEADVSSIASNGSTSAYIFPNGAKFAVSE